MSSPVLQVWVRKSRNTLRVVDLHVGVIRSQTVKGDQVNDCLFPRKRFRLVEVFNRCHVVLFHFIKCTLVSNVTLSSHVGHRIQLEKDQVWHVLANNIGIVIDCSMAVWGLRHCIEIGRCI